MFKNLFGGKKKDKPKSNVNVEQTLQNLTKKINDMDLLLNNYEVRAKALQEEAKKKLKEGDKNGAKRILVKKKKIVDQIKQTEGAIMMMEEQKGMLESVSTTKDILETLKGANEVIKQNKVDVEELYQIQDDIEDQKQVVGEINDFFSDYVDGEQEGVEDDLKALEDEMEKEADKILPSAVKNNITDDKIKTTNEMKDLEAFLG